MDIYMNDNEIAPDIRIIKIDVFKLYICAYDQRIYNTQC